VKDTGRGIEPDERANIFEPFYRGKGKRTKVGGLGLGLPHSRMIARALGGDLTLSETGLEGSTFTVTLPAGEE
jgi:signal transduction histidine kinase